MTITSKMTILSDYKYNGIPHELTSSAFGAETIHLFQISRDNWPAEKVSGRLFSCQVQSLFLSTNASALLFKVDFPLSNS